MLGPRWLGIQRRVGFSAQSHPDRRTHTAERRAGAERMLEPRTGSGKLKAIPEADGSGTLFDNTLIAWCRDMGDAHLHNQKSMRFVLVGGAGGYLKTDPNGRYLLGRGDGASNRHERVLLGICDAMGITDFSGFGDTRLGADDKTPFPGLAAT